MLQPRIETDEAIFFGPFEERTWKVGQTLTIGIIVDKNGKEVDSLVLEPQGIAHLISNEKVNLPQDVCALAHVLTHKCVEGLLTLNIGVVDPGWNEKISTSILNFGSTQRLLSKGDQFIRLTFHRIIIESDEAVLLDEFIKSPNIKKGIVPPGYIRDVRSKAVSYFGESFLDVRSLVNKVTAQEHGRLRSTMLKYVPIAAFSLAIFAFLVTLGGVYATQLLSKHNAVLEQGRPVSAAEVERLELRVEQLERALAESRSVRPVTPKLKAGGKLQPPR